MDYMMEVDGKEHRLIFKGSNLADLQEQHGIDVFQIFRDANAAAQSKGIDANDPQQAANIDINFGLHQIRGLLWAGLRTSIHNITIKKASAVMDIYIEKPDGLAVLTTTLFGALTQCGLFKTPTVETLEEPGKEESTAPLVLASGGDK